MTDAQLLEQLRQGSHDAFAELVRRHINWVYSVAHRRVHDAHQAEDVAQAVFTVLFQKPPRLKEGQALSLWLFTVVHHASLQALRSESRRRHRETEAAKMRELTQTGDESDGWSDLAPELDELVQRLGATERQAVLLRFYEQRTFAEVGTILGITEEAARKRTSRAVDRLRTMLTRRGVAIPSTTLAGLFLTEAVKPAPPALAAQMTSTIVSTAGVPAVGSAFTLAKGVITMMTISKIKLAAAAIFAAIVLVGGGVIVIAQIADQRQPAPAPAPAAQQQAGNADWRAKFDSVYRLDDQEVLKLIPPPFIPERDQFYQNLFARLRRSGDVNERTPDYIDSEWRAGKLVVIKTGSVSPARSLRMVLASVLGLKSYEFEGPQELLMLRLPGDWIVRPEANISDKLQVLSAMLTNTTGKLVQVDRKNVERDVVVASGDLKPDAAGTVVHFVDVQLPGNGQGGGGGMVFSGGNQGPAKGSIQAFLDAVAARCGMIVVNDTKAPASATLSWDRFFGWSDLSMMPDGPDKQTLLQGRTESLSTQTGLKFTVEKRKVDVWQFTQTP